MEKRKVISRKNFRLRLPLSTYLAIYILLDKINAPGFAYGILITVFFIIGAFVVYDFFNVEEINILDKAEE